jgi:hypothetical protein
MSKKPPDPFVQCAQHDTVQRHVGLDWVDRSMMVELRLLRCSDLSS